MKNRWKGIESKGRRKERIEMMKGHIGCGSGRYGRVGGVERDTL